MEDAKPLIPSEALARARLRRDARSNQQPRQVQEAPAGITKLVVQCQAEKVLARGYVSNETAAKSATFVDTQRHEHYTSLWNCRVFCLQRKLHSVSRRNRARKMKLTEAQEFFSNMNEHEKELYQKKKLRSARRREVYAIMDEQKKELKHAYNANNGST